MVNRDQAARCSAVRLSVVERNTFFFAFAHRGAGKKRVPRTFFDISQQSTAQTRFTIVQIIYSIGCWYLGSDFDTHFDDDIAFTWKNWFGMTEHDSRTVMLTTLLHSASFIATVNRVEVCFRRVCFVPLANAFVIRADVLFKAGANFNLIGIYATLFLCTRWGAAVKWVWHLKLTLITRSGEILTRIAESAKFTISTESTRCKFSGDTINQATMFTVRVLVILIRPIKCNAVIMCVAWRSAGFEGPVVRLIYVTQSSILSTCPKLPTSHTRSTAVYSVARFSSFKHYLLAVSCS